MTSLSMARQWAMLPSHSRDGMPFEAKRQRLLLYSDLYEMVLDLNRGGVIVSLIDKPTSRNDASAEKAFYLNELRDYFERGSMDVN